MKEIKWTGLFLFASYFFKHVALGQPISAWRRNFLDEALLAIFILLGLVIWHFVKAARSECAEIQKEAERKINRFPSLHLPSGYDPILVNLPATRQKRQIWLAAFVCVGVCVTAGYGVLRLARPSVPKIEAAPTVTKSVSFPSPTSTPTQNVIATPSPFPTPTPARVLSSKPKQQTPKRKRPCTWEDTLLGRC